MHDVSLRSATNRMDAHNLAVVVTPNLVSGTNPLRDVMMCSIPSAPAPFSPLAASPTSSSMGKTTLGAVIKLCIQRYYEVFDEVPDRSEAIPQREFEPSPPSPASSHGDRRAHDDDDDIDDAMLVMPIGPSGSNPNNHASTTNHHKPGRPAPPPPLPYKPRTLKRAPHQHQQPASPRSAVTTLAGRSGAPSSYTPYGTVNRARSTISIERGTARGKGSISVGRGAAARTTGAGVEATGITAAGFFTPPDAPPVPPLLPSQVKANGGHLPVGPSAEA